MAIKLVVSDLDGTLLNRTSRLDSNTVRAVKSLNEEGILFTFATGRIDLNTWHFAKQLNLQLPIISCNGALIRYPFTGEPVYEAYLPDAPVDAILRLFQSEKRDFFVYTPTSIYYPDYSLAVERFRYYNLLAASNDLPQIEMINYTDWQKNKSNLCPPGTVKLYCHAKDREQVSKLGALVDSYPELTALKCAKEAVDIIVKGSDKSKGLLKVADLFHIGIDEIAAFGDEENDLKMLQTVGYPFLMKNAVKTLRNRLQSYHLAENHNCAGFARAVRQYIL